MASLSCTPARDLLSSSASSFSCSHSSLSPSTPASSSPGSWLEKLHDGEWGLHFGRWGQRWSPSSLPAPACPSWVRSCERKPPAPFPKKRVRIPTKRIRTDQPWWNNIFKGEDGSGLRTSLSGAETIRHKGGRTSDSNSNSERGGRGSRQFSPPTLQESDNPSSPSTTELSGMDKMPPVRIPPAPLLEALKDCAAKDMAAFHYPGPHRETPGTWTSSNSLVDALGAALFSTKDQPKLSSQLNSLFTSSSVIAAAQSKAALAFGADSTFFLINGTTCGIQAAIMALCTTGAFLILPRNCHPSAITGMVLSGSKPWYVIPEYDANWGVCQGLSAESVAAAIAGVKDAGGLVGAVLLESPTQLGICSPIREIANICHGQNVPLIVDEAHGAHLKFHLDLPESALEQGADLTVQSTNKVLGSLTQSAMLHLSSVARVDRLFLIKCLQLVQSSSPSYLLLSSLDVARAQFSASLADDSDPFSSYLLESAMDFAFLAKECLREIPNIVILDESTIQHEEGKCPQLDPLRITVGLWELELDGYAADDVLRKKFGIIAEFPSFQSITFGINIGTTARDVARLVEAWRTLSMWFTKNSNYMTLETAKNVLRGDRGIIKPFLDLPCSPAVSPREVFFSPTMAMETENVVGQISAELLCPHPPVIPVITPGDVISEQALDFLRSTLERGGLISGPSDTCLQRITVCKR